MSEFQVVGFEGPFPKRATVAWGTAVVTMGDMVINPVTKMNTNRTSLELLASKGNVTLLEEPLELPIETSNVEQIDPLVVCAYRGGYPFYIYLDQAREENPSLELTSMVVLGKKFTMHYIVFKDMGHLHLFARCVNELLFEFLEEECIQKKRSIAKSSLDELVSMSMTLDFSRPEILATNVYAWKDVEEDIRRVYRACARSEFDKCLFDSTLRYLKASNLIVDYNKPHVVSMDQKDHKCCCL